MKISGESRTGNRPAAQPLGIAIQYKPRFAWPPSGEVAHLTWGKVIDRGRLTGYSPTTRLPCRTGTQAWEARR